VLTNADLERIVDTSDQWITERTGIKERRIAADDETASTMGTAAARQALSAAGVSPEQLDLIITATVTGDMTFPATACLMQAALGAGNAGAFDIGAGCTGFVYGLSVASQFVESGVYDHILVVGTEKLSFITNWSDRTTCVLFGDGAGAAVLGPCESDRGILGFELGAEGTGGDLLCVPSGGSLRPLTHERLDAGEHYLRMNGREVFKFAARALSDSPARVMARLGIAPSEVAMLIPHQANSRITEAAIKRLNVPSERVYSNVERFGNTSAASIPIALSEAVGRGLIRDGDIVILTGFGAGLTYGTCAMKWVG